MLASLSLILISSIVLSYFFTKINIPSLIAYLLVGIVFSPYLLNLIDVSIVNISIYFRTIALIIILIKAGLTLKPEDLLKSKKSIIMLSFIPASFEIIAYTIFTPLFFDFSYLDGALLGSVIAAVSPAVVVPKMVKMIEDESGTDKGIPQTILAGSSLDDIFVIVIFTTLLSLSNTHDFSPMVFLHVPFSIVGGIAVGVILGFVISFLFKKFVFDNNIRIILLLAISFFLKHLETYVEYSSLLAVISLAMCIRKIDVGLKDKITSLWAFFSIMLFVLIGSNLNLAYLSDIGFKAVAIIFLALGVRSIGTILCFVNTDLNKKERLFAVIAYMPKATVQAALGSVALEAGLPVGKLILTLAVAAILLTAPLGAYLMDITEPKLLNKDKK